jgi:hypothetical protein
VNQRQPTTLTLFYMDEFFAELARRKLGCARCEAIIRDQGSGQLGPMRRYMVTLTAHDEGASEVLACTLLVGECWALFADHEPRHGENLDKAKEIVTAHLQANGLTVLPGVYHHASDGIATASELWHFDDNRQLIPIAPEASGESA